jgi:hypothetical protein
LVAAAAAAAALAGFGGVAAGATNVTWAQQSPPVSPPSVQEGAMAFDPALNETVLFGGDSTAGGTGAKTWGWNGTTWTVLATTGPGARKDMQMVYDDATQSIVLFGGFGEPSGHPYQDTWTFNGVWTKQQPLNVPTVVDAYGMAYDGANQTVVMTGGQRTSSTPSTWVWNGTNWKKFTSVPFPTTETLNWPSMAYDPTVSGVILFGGLGGVNGVTNQNTTWEWNGATWTQLAPALSPTVRKGAPMAYDPGLGGLVLFGGIGGLNRGTRLLGDTWLFDGTTWVHCRAVTPPTPRGFAQMAPDATGHLMLTGGQVDIGQVNGTWQVQP